MIIWVFSIDSIQMILPVGKEVDMKQVTNALKSCLLATRVPAYVGLYGRVQHSIQRWRDVPCRESTNH
jgi:esterase/lipase superfamily enzyme